MNRLGSAFLLPSLPTILLCCLLLIPAPVLAASPGTSAASFLTIGFGSRAQGLANGVVALADDASATYFNPAGLAGARRELTLSHSVWFQDIALSQAALALPYGPSPVLRTSSPNGRGNNESLPSPIGTGNHGTLPSPDGRGQGEGGARWTLGLAVTRLGVSGLEARTAETARPDGSFGAEDLSIGLSLARPVGSGAVGATAKLVQQRIASTVGRGAALDLGARLPVASRTTAALSIRNLGPRLRLGSASFPLPLSVHAGLAYAAPLTVVFETTRHRDGRGELVLGTEYWLNPSVALRGGYFHQLGTARAADGRDPSLAPFPGVSAGFGLRLGDRLGLDYAIVPFRDLGSAHRVSLSIRF